MLDAIPDGWFLNALKDVRSPIRLRGDTHVHLYWQCELQWFDGGGRQCDATGNTPEEAIAAAVNEVNQRWPGLVSTSR